MRKACAAQPAQTLSYGDYCKLKLRKVWEKKCSPPARLVGKMGFGVVIVNDYNDQVEARVPVPDQRTWQTNMHRSYCVLNYCHDTDYSRNLRCSTCFVGWMLFFPATLGYFPHITGYMSKMPKPVVVVHVSCNIPYPLGITYSSLPICHSQIAQHHLQTPKSSMENLGFFLVQSPLVTDLVYM